MTCPRCGRPAHVTVGGRCVDCWTVEQERADDQPRRYLDRQVA